MKKTRRFSIWRVLGGILAGILALRFVISQPTLHSNQPVSDHIDATRLRNHVEMLSVTCHPRNWHYTQNLDRCAAYIGAQFALAGARVTEQPFQVGNAAYKNIIGHFGPENGPRLVVGAHYDSCDSTPGADDNASGVAGLIELAYLLGRKPLGAGVELVAFTLEEPPHFRSPQMGSAHHAAMLASNHVQVRGVIVLEMIGFYDDQRFSQAYPSPLLYLLYPTRGNFIGVIGRWDQGDWIAQVKGGMKGATDLPVYSIRAPAALPGVDFSDHLNYWNQGFPAVMITDTAFYRNNAYHKPADTPDRLDYTRMGKAVLAIHAAIRHLLE